MRKLFLAFLFSLTVFLSYAQFNFSIGAAGFSNPDGQIIGFEDNVGFAFILEPKYQMAKAVRVGLASKLGIGNPMKSLLGDINFKLADPGIVYLGLGYGIVSLQKTNSSINGLGSVNFNDSQETFKVFAPRIGLQTDFDVELTYFLIPNSGFFSIGFSRVFGFKG